MPREVSGTPAFQVVSMMALTHSSLEESSHISEVLKCYRPTLLPHERENQEQSSSLASLWKCIQRLSGYYSVVAVDFCFLT